MVSKKDLHPHTPGVYRDEPDRDDAASMSSAVLLGDIDSFPDEELPAYEDHPSSSSSAVPRPVASAGEDLSLSEFYYPPDLPFSTHGMNKEEFRTRFPNFSTSASQLEAMIQQQAKAPPPYFVHIHGSHTETRRNNNKETKDKVVDFDFSINLTEYIVPPGQFTRNTPPPIELLPDNVRGFRGAIFPSLNPNVADVEAQEALTSWCQRYVADKAKIKSFTLKREVINHDQKRVEQLIRSALAEANYRGHVHITFPTTHTSVVVYSPGLINQWRITTWIRWLFYLTFLWVFAWPFLWFMTSRYEVVKSVWQYASSPPGDDMGREPTVLSEVEWFYKWESAIKRAAIARMKCKDTCLDEEFRLATVAADQRGAEAARNPQPLPSTGNAFADNAFGLLGQGLRVAESFSNARGWGGDC
ncbi:hypothetical protein BGZ60DRAFT_387661 [Tricladium varicosporioides]|nr:hypothetical protein BGZ60DRAFT_387661 [Hymenoscyphus varicosporioides]